jgi:Cep192 domain 4
MGNAAESGSGGGLRLQNVNGTDVVTFPTTPSRWYSPSVTNNIIVDNVAGWDGAGVSLQDALAVNFINNTVMSNDTTASSGVLFNTLGAPLASSGGPTCTANCGTTSAPQPAGLVSIQNSPVLVANLPATITCPAGHFAGTTATNGTCRSVSYPLIANDVFWQNRSFYIGVGALGTGTQNQQNVVALYNAFTTTAAASQPSADATSPNVGGMIITGGTGACVPASYWDIGVRGDTGPTNHSSTVTLAPSYSVLTNITGYNAVALHNAASNPTVVSQYCNGSRWPPEFKSMGYQVPPGISDATVPNPIFNLTPAATVDEGNNWINISWGPLAETNAVTGTTLGNYALAAGSPAINFIPSTATANFTEAPTVDFFNNPRKANGAVDAGAVEFAGGPATAAASVTGGPLVFGNVATGTTSGSRQLVLHNTGTAPLTGITLVFASTGTAAPRFSRPAGAAGGTCGATLTPAAGTCTINVVFSPNALGAFTGTLTITANVAVTGSPVSLSGTGVAPVISAALTPASWTTSATRGVGLAGPTQVFTLTNTGNVNLTGIAQATLGGTNSADFAIVRLLSTCGPAGGGQLLGQTSLAPGATCAVTVQFRPLTTDTAGSVRNATVSVTDAAGTQSSTLSGTAN